MSTKARPILETLTPQQTDDLRARLDRLIDRSGGPEACWPFTGGSVVNGYGMIYTTTSAKTRRLVRAHRLVFELANGESPPSVDHACHDSDDCRLGTHCPHRLCCNPAHLVASTVGANAARARRGVHRHPGLCGAGRHPRTPENTYETPGGGTRCRPCDAERARDAREASRLARPPSERPRGRRPPGLSLPQLVDWALEGQSGDGCWAWRNVRPHGTGYISVHFGGRTRQAHALVYEARIGPIPPGHVVDHICHDPETCEGGLACPHRACVNPAHLLATTRGANSSAARSRRRRPDKCVQGHAFTPENTYTDARGHRQCRTCHAQRVRDAHEAAKPEGWVDGRRRADGKCRNGHVIAVLGVNKYGRCVACVRENNRRYKQKRSDASA